MKLHHTLIERLVKIYSTYGGYREETKLRQELAGLELTEYTRQSGEKILVEEQELKKHLDK
jgi:hypothetical protein